MPFLKIRERLARDQRETRQERDGANPDGLTQTNEIASKQQQAARWS